MHDKVKENRNKIICLKNFIAKLVISKIKEAVFNKLSFSSKQDFHLIAYHSIKIKMIGCKSFQDSTFLNTLE